MNDLDYDFYEFQKLVEDTTANLRKLATMQQNMRWQFGEPEWFEDFVKELHETKHGWVSSNC